MRGRHKEKGRGAAVLFLLMFILAGTASTQRLYDSQDDFHLHAKLTGHTYRDDKIEVRAPEDWSITVRTATSSGSTQVTFARGAVLRKGKYILELCTGCGQVSGIVGGRFSEIAGMLPSPGIAWIREPCPCLVASRRRLRLRTCLTASISGSDVILGTSSTTMLTIAGSQERRRRSGTGLTLRSIVLSEQCRGTAAGISSTTPG